MVLTYSKTTVLPLRYEQTTCPGNSRTKHVDLKIKWLQDHLQKGDIKIHHVPTSLNMSDILTKDLPRETFVRCITNALKPDDILPPIAQNEGEC